MAKYVIGLFVLIFSQRVCGQTFYITHEGKVSRISIKDNKVTGDSLTLCDEVWQPMSIAIYQNTLYSVNFIFAGKGIISGNRIDNCTAFDGKTYGGNALTVDINGDFYTTWGDTLVKVDINKGIHTKLGVIPFTSAGDLAFYNNSLYLASTQGIVKINLQDVSKSELAIPSDITFWGLTTAAVSSTQNKLYAMAPENYETTIYELDLDNNRLGKVVAVIPYIVNDVASYEENGSTSVMEITEIKQIANCVNDGKGTIRVICRENLSDYRYTLNGVTNTTGIFTNVHSGAQSVTVTSDIETKTVPFTAKFILEKPELIIIKKHPLCTAKGEIAITANSNADEYKIRYNNVTYNIGNLFQDLMAGTYQFEILNQDGCVVDRREIKLTQEICRITVTQINVTEECDDPGKAVINIATASHNDVYSYSLNNLQLNNNGIFRDVVPGNYKITIKSAEDEKSIDIIVPDYNALKPTVQYTATNLLCDEPASIRLSAQGLSTTSYKIKFDNNLYAFDHVFQVTAIGKYHFEIYKPDGCVFSIIDIPISRSKCEIELLTPTVNQECDVAFKGSVQINTKQHTYAYTYKIANGPSNTSGLFNNLEPGVYNVSVSSIEDSKQISITIPDYKALSPVVSITKADAECDLQGIVKFSLSTKSEGYQIRLGASVFPFNYDFKLREGEHDFTVLKPNGCILASYHVELKKLPCDILELPNAFTPNGDGVNDVFQPNQGAEAKSFSLKIFNRTGQLMFNSNNISEGWRGEQGGKIVPIGVYYWIINYSNNTGKNLQKTGSVTLIR